MNRNIDADQAILRFVRARIATLSKLDRFCEQMELIARKGLPS